MRHKKRWLGALGGTVLLIAAIQLQPRAVTAADHADSPLVDADRAADLGSLYAWHTERGTLVTVLTFAGLRVSVDEPVYDKDHLYTIHIDNTAKPGEKANYSDNDNDNASDIQIHVRFGQNNLGEWGVQFTGVPGADDMVFDGPVQTELTNGTARVIAGDFDDPFFFDFEGFVATRDNLADDADPLDFAFGGVNGGETVDFFAGTNTMAIVVEMDAAAAVGENPDNYLQIWGTSGRLR